MYNLNVYGIIKIWWLLAIVLIATLVALLLGENDGDG